MTVRTVRSICRLRSAVSSRYSDSGVVTRMCGGVRSIAARSRLTVVSPVRTAAVIAAARGRAPRATLRDAAPRLGEVLVDVGAQRLQRRDVDDADLVGQRRAEPFLEERVERGQERRERLAGAGRRRNQRVAARAESPAQPARCAGVGSPSVSLNQRATTRMKVIHGAASGRGDSLFYRSAEHAASAERSLTASFAAWALIVLLKYANTGRPRAISALSQSAQSSSTGFA